MDDSIRRASRQGHTIDITTTGRRTGRLRRIELVFHNIDGRLLISGSPSPRTRAWILNLLANPRLTVHLKRTVRVDLPATARVIADPTERRAVAGWIVANAWPNMDAEQMVEQSPMIEVTLDELAESGSPARASRTEGPAGE